jgi:hypothetical protein
MKFYKTTVTLTFPVEVEAESQGEAERIIDGVLSNATSLKLLEGEDGDIDQLSSDGPFSFERTLIAAVRDA